MKALEEKWKNKDRKEVIYKGSLAENIISEYMAELESKLRRALDENKFYSVITLNRCRDFFDMDHVESMNTDDFKECI